MKKAKENPNHHMGKETGYELIDGVYSIAPLYRQQFAALLEQQEGIKEMLRIVTYHASRDLEEIAKTRNRIWESLKNDIGLDISKTYIYQGGKIRETQSPLKEA